MSVTIKTTPLRRRPPNGPLQPPLRPVILPPRTQIPPRSPQKSPPPPPRPSEPSPPLRPAAFATDPSPVARPLRKFICAACGRSVEAGNVPPGWYTLKRVHAPGSAPVPPGLSKKAAARFLRSLPNGVRACSAPSPAWRPICRVSMNSIAI